MDAAYAAGLIDGEGCIYVVDSNPKKGTRARAFYATVEVGMSKKGLPVLRRLHAEHGGRLYPSRAATERWEEAWMWHVHGSEAETFLTLIEPHLCLKREQAALALRAQAIRSALPQTSTGRARWSELATQQCLSIRDRIMQLNAKGPSTLLSPPVEMPTARLFALAAGDGWGMPKTSLFGTTWEPFSGPWPSSGMGSHGVLWTLDSSASPNDARECSLSDVLETGDVPRKYYLSPKACAGILRRAARRGRTLPGHLEASLLAVAGETISTEPEPSSPPSPAP